MSDLQIALLILGAVVIVAVVVYNRVQEVRFRQRAESAFGPQEGDALLEPAPARNGTQERIEPQFQADGADHGQALASDRQEPQAIGEPALPAAPVIRVPPPERAEPKVERAAVPAEPPRQAPPAAPPPATSMPVTADTTAAPVRAASPAAAPALPDVASQIAYVAEIHAEQPLPATALQQLARGLGPLGARCSLAGRHAEDEGWAAIDAGAPGDWEQIRAALQLVDRKGAATQQDLTIFKEAVGRCAAAAGARALLPDVEPSLGRARELDGFCAQVDVVVGINVIAARGRPFVGTRLRGLAEGAGFRIGQGVFFYPDANGAPRFTLENHNQTPISNETLRTLQTNGLTLLLDVPRQADGVAAFDQMIAVGRQLAQSLGGSLVDDNNAPVTEAGLEQIRSQLRTIYATMEARGIAPGGPVALRLFA